MNWYLRWLGAQLTLAVVAYWVLRLWRVLPLVLVVGCTCPRFVQEQVIPECSGGVIEGRTCVR